VATSKEAPLSASDILTEEAEALNRERGASVPSDTPLSALCLSGGGIRSASFCVGFIQGLARNGLLDGWDYISTVSGGGFAGGWLAAWIQRHEHKLSGVADELQGPVDPAPVRCLRARSAYLGPLPGLSSGAFWAFAGLYCQKIFLNWVVLLPVLLFVPLFPQSLIHNLELATASVLNPAFPAWLGRMFGPDLVIRVLRVVVIGGQMVGIGMFLVVPCAYVISRDRLPRWLQGRRALHGFFWWLFWAGFMLASMWSGLSKIASGSSFLVVLYFVAFGVAVYASGSLVVAAFRKAPLRRSLVAGVVAGAVEGLALFFAGRAFPDPSTTREAYACLIPPFFVLIRIVAGTIYLRLAVAPEATGELSWWNTARVWLLLRCVGLAALSLLVVFGPGAVLALSIGVQTTFFVGGLVSCGIFAALGYSSAFTAQRQKAALREVVRGAALVFFGGIAALFIVIVHSIAVHLLLQWLAPWFVWMHQLPLPKYIDPSALSNLELLVFTLIVLLPVVLGALIDANKLTLHTMYRSSLVSTFLAASHLDRISDSLTGLDSADDVDMSDLPQRPLLVINAAMRIDAGLSGASRGGTAPFTMTALHAGSARTGYRPTAAYGGGLSLGTAMAISGAAISQNVGGEVPAYVRLLSSIVNIGLGRWAGNPSVESTWKRSRPSHPGVVLLGTSERARYVYLSDGGHFENLGLYEMIRRRCKRIVVIDASCDPKYICDDLANAIQKVKNPAASGGAFRAGGHYADIARFASTCP